MKPNSKSIALFSKWKKYALSISYNVKMLIFAEIRGYSIVFPDLQNHSQNLWDEWNSSERWMNTKKV